MNPQILYSIDVGLHGLGIGCFQGKELLCGWYSPISRAPGERGAGLWGRAASDLYLPVPGQMLAIETMQVYRGVKAWHVDPADLLELQGLAGAIAARFYNHGAKVENFLPRQWKGTIPKQIMTNRIRGWVDHAGWGDRLMIPKQSRRTHDLLDGVGLGFVVLRLGGRLTGRDYPTWA